MSENNTVEGSSKLSITTIGLLRHGTTLWNEEGRIQGKENSPLSVKGKENTRGWSFFLPEFRWDRIVASDLGRVQETVSILNINLCLPITLDSRLQEQFWGKWEGRKLKDIEHEEPQNFQELLQLGWQFKPPGGESRRSVQQRTAAALISAAETWPGKRILVVCHQGVIKCLLYHLLNRSFLPHEEPIISKDKLHIITCKNKTFEIEKLNISHSKSS